jgi:hypothetical protein
MAHSLPGLRATHRRTEAPWLQLLTPDRILHPLGRMNNPG